MRSQSLTWLVNPTPCAFFFFLKLVVVVFGYNYHVIPIVRMLHKRPVPPIKKSYFYRNFIYDEAICVKCLRRKTHTHHNLLPIEIFISDQWKKKQRVIMWWNFKRTDRGRCRSYLPSSTEIIESVSVCWVMGRFIVRWSTTTFLARAIRIFDYFYSYFWLKKQKTEHEN